MDFTNAGGGTCATGTAYAANATCTVNVTFSPKFAGTRYGAVLLDDGTGNVLATGYVYGTGTGPQLIFIPGIQSTISSGWIHPQAVAVDGAGNLYVANYPTSPGASGGSVVKETLTGGSYTQSTIGSGIVGPTGVAVDGAGNVYIADASVHAVFKETPTTGGYIQSQLPTLGMAWPIGVAVDGSGNVYVTEAYDNLVLKEALSGGSYTQSTIVTGLSYPMGIAVDGSGNVYVADSGNNRLVEETPSAGGYTQSTIASGFGANLLGDNVMVDGSNNLFIAETSLNQVVKLPWTGNAYGAPVTISSLNQPLAVAADGSGNVYFTTYSGGFYKLDYAERTDAELCDAYSCWNDRYDRRPTDDHDLEYRQCAVEFPRSFDRKQSKLRSGLHSKQQWGISVPLGDRRLLYGGYAGSRGILPVAHQLCSNGLGQYQRLGGAD